MIWYLHGAVGMAADWAAVVAADPGNRRAVDLWCLLEEGADSLEKAGARVAEMAEVGDFLVGYSMGGRIALHALLAEPGKWAGATVISAHPGLGSEAVREERRKLDAGWAELAWGGKWGDFLRRWEGQGVLEGRVEGLGDRGELEEKRELVGRSFLSWGLGEQKDLRARLEKVEAPVCFVAGERDGKFLLLAVEMAGLVRKGTAVRVEGCGHRIPWEREAERASAFQQNGLGPGRA